ncbi:hypothetical protein HDU67_001763 [Dinochytrium kinnereticum]|nr:hypothetical protein HDU67_001763 [Dinochytrium kinnereticum]
MPVSSHAHAQHAQKENSSALSSLYVISQKTVERLAPVASAAHGYASTAASFAKAFLDKYPPIKAFVYTLAGTSAVPLAVFLGWAGIVLTICLAIAGTGVAFVQGGFMVFGGFILFWFLAGAFIFTAIATFWFTAAYFAYKVAQAIDRSSKA